MRAKFPAFLCLLSVFAVGCRHDLSIGRTSLVGDFQPVQGAKSLRLLLKEGGNYQELDFLEKVPTKLGDGSVVVSVDGIGPIDTGSWSYAGSTLSLRSNRPNQADRLFTVARTNSSIVITQLSSGTKVVYAKVSAADAREASQSR